MPDKDWTTYADVWIQYLEPGARGVLEDLETVPTSSVELARGLVKLGRTIILIAPGKQAANLEEMRPWFSARVSATKEAIEALQWVCGAIDTRRAFMYSESVESWNDLADRVPASTVLLIDGASLLPATPPEWAHTVSPDGVEMLAAENERKVELGILMNHVADKGPAVGFTTIIKNWNPGSQPRTRRRNVPSARTQRS